MKPIRANGHRARFYLPRGHRERRRGPWVGQGFISSSSALPLCVLKEVTCPLCAAVVSPIKGARAAPHRRGDRVCAPIAPRDSRSRVTPASPPSPLPSPPGTAEGPSPPPSLTLDQATALLVSFPNHICHGPRRKQMARANDFLEGLWQRDC